MPPGSHHRPEFGAPKPPYLGTHKSLKSLKAISTRRLWFDLLSQKQEIMSKYLQSSTMKGVLASIGFLFFLAGYASFSSEIYYIKTQLTELFDAIFSGNIRI